MLVIETYDPDTNATLAYLRLNPNNDRARTTKLCDQASHFISATTAALVRQRYRTAFPDPLRVKDCHCIVGLEYTNMIRRPS